MDRINKQKIINYPGWELKYFDKAQNFRNYQQHLIKKYINGTVAEVGPGNGINAKMYKKYCDKLHLFEPTKKLSAHLKKKFKSEAKIKVFNKKFKTNKSYYNSIIYLDVIEHIKDHKKEIINAYDSLKKNGHLIINVPAFQFLYSQFDKDVDHIKRFKKNDFEKILEKKKVGNLNMFYYDSIGFCLSLVSRIFTKNYKSNFGLKIKFWNNLIILSKILDIIFLYSVGKSLAVIVRK